MDKQPAPQPPIDSTTMSSADLTQLDEVLAWCGDRLARDLTEQASARDVDVEAA